MLSIIIPALNADLHLASNLPALILEARYAEVIVVDGGSDDRSRSVAEDAGARVIAADQGRGTQLAKGARASGGDWLFFLHADTRLEEGWRDAVDSFTTNSENRRRAAYFRFSLDDGAPQARKLERLVKRRCRWFGLPYGDQGLLISRSFYTVLGGYKEIPLMEDVNLVRRIGRKKLIGLDTTAITSAERYRKNGYQIRRLRNAALLSLYFLGVPTPILAKLYRL